MAFVHFQNLSFELDFFPSLVQAQLIEIQRHHLIFVIDDDEGVSLSALVENDELEL